MKINFRKSLKLITLLISSLLIATASAAAYVTLQWTTTATVAVNPKACFIKWDGGTKANTFDYSVNIFPNVKTVDEDITYGVWNNDTAMRNVYFRLSAENTNSTDVTSLNYTIYNSTNTIFTKLYNAFTTGDDSDAWSSAVPLAVNATYHIWLEIQCASGAGVGHTPQFTFEMKVENP